MRYLYFFSILFFAQLNLLASDPNDLINLPIKEEKQQFHQAPFKKPISRRLIFSLRSFITLVSKMPIGTKLILKE